MAVRRSDAQRAHAFDLAIHTRVREIDARPEAARTPAEAYEQLALMMARAMGRSVRGMITEYRGREEDLGISVEENERRERTLFIDGPLQLRALARLIYGEPAGEPSEEPTEP